MMVPSSPRESVLKFFEEKFGNAPEFLVRAPGRVNLIGVQDSYWPTSYIKQQAFYQFIIFSL